MNGYRERVFFLFGVHYKLDISGVWMKNEVYKRKLNTWDEFLARILDAATLYRNVNINSRGIARDLRTGIAKSNDVNGGIFEHLLRTATNLLFKH